MKYARYWIPVLVGFALGGALSWRMGRGAMRELLAASKADPRPQMQQAERSENLRNVSAAGISDELRFGKLFAALQETRALKRRHEMNSALGDLEARDMEALLARVEKLGGVGSSADLANAILERWFELDAKAAQQWVRNRPKNQNYWVVWAKADPESAYQELLANPRLRWAQEMVKYATAGLAGGNKAEEGRLLLNLPESEMRNMSLGVLLQEWARKSPSEALGFVKAMPAGLYRSAFAEEIFSQMRGRDVESAIKALPEILPEMRTESAPALIANLAETLAGKDVKRALDWVSALPEENRPPAAFAAVAREWAKTDPAAALAWCAANGLDPGELNYRQSGPDQSVVAVAMRANPEKTLQWIRAQPEGEARDTLLELALAPSRTATQAISQNSEVLLEAMNLLSGEAQARAAKKIAGNLASLGPTKAAELQSWINQMPDPSLRDAAIVGAGQQFGGTGTKREDFLAQFSEPSERDAAVEGLASRQAVYDPTKGADLAATISDPTRRQRVLDGFVVDWLRKDSKVAGQWLDSAKTVSPDWATAWRQEAAAH